MPSTIDATASGISRGLRRGCAGAGGGGNWPVDGVGQSRAVSARGLYCCVTFDCGGGGTIGAGATMVLASSTTSCPQFRQKRSSGGTNVPQLERFIFLPVFSWNNEPVER